VTKEAKIGLLLGLGFIIAIAVVLRDVNKAPDESLGESLVVSQNQLEQSVPGEGDLQEGVKQLEEQSRNIFETDTNTQEMVSKNDLAREEQSPELTEEVRYTLELPAEEPMLDTELEQVREEQAEHQEGQMSALQQIVDKLNEQLESRDTQVVTPPVREKAQAYVVQSGDNLTKIARKVYGKQSERELWQNIKRIHQANLKIIPEMNDLRVGQKLIIPGGQKATAQEIKAQPDSKTEPVKQKPRFELYVVQEGDSLWKIAQARLGDGKRYPEIKQLNKKLINDQGDVHPGWKLKLPQN